MKKIVIGVDVSKAKLDLLTLDKSSIILKECIVNNVYEAIAEELVGVLNDFSIPKNELLICAEHTGKYTYPLCCVCDELGLELWLENPSQIKLSSGVRRGKNDKQDAYTIAQYALRYMDKAKLFQFSEHIIQTLKELISERSYILPIEPSIKDS